MNRHASRSGSDSDGDKLTPEIIVPGGYRAPSGLVLPTEVPRVPRVALPAELGVEASLLIAARAPAFIDQVLVFATQEELGLPVTSRDVVLDAICEIPFWPAMKFLARFQRDLWPVAREQGGQLELVRRYYGAEGDYARRATAFLRAGLQHVLFSEQQLFTLQKLLLMYAADSEADQELTQEEYVGLMIALAAVPGTFLGPQVAEFEREGSGGVTDETWLRLFVGHGGFIGRGVLKYELARTHLLYVNEANSDRAKAHRDYCPLDDWVQEAFQLSFLELQATGFSLWAGSHMGDVESTPVLVDSSYFGPTALGDKAELALAAVSSDRAWYRDLFLRGEHDDRRLAFEITPFLQRPALRFPDGRVMPFAPRALEGWIGATGAYYRFFDLALSRGSSVRNRFTRFNGFLVEQHVLTAARAAHATVTSSSIWVPGVIGEQVVGTRDGETRTPDVSLDYGTDLVVIEVTSGRPTTHSIVDADPQAIRADIEKLLEAKITQVANRIGELQDGTLTLLDVRIDEVRRIWPIVVNSEGLLQTPSLWAYLRGETNALAALDKQRVQPLTLLDLEDIERLMELISAGNSLIAILENKTRDGWRDREFASWYEAEGTNFPTGHFAYIDNATTAAFQEMIGALLGSQTSEQYQERVEAARRARGDPTSAGA
jgi:hypothetical protein